MNRELIENIAKKNYATDGFFNSFEFKKDIRNLFIVRKMINRFLLTGQINDKLLVNNIIILINTFGVHKTNLLIKEVLIDDEKQWSVAKTILHCLDFYTLNHDSTELNNDIIKIISTNDL